MLQPPLKFAASLRGQFKLTLRPQDVYRVRLLHFAALIGRMRCPDCNSDITEPVFDGTIWRVARLHYDTCPNYRKIRHQESDEV